MVDTSEEYKESVLATAVHALLEDGQKEAALQLVGSKIGKFTLYRRWLIADNGHEYCLDLCQVELLGNKKLCKSLKENSEMLEAVTQVFREIIKPERYDNNAIEFDDIEIEPALRLIEIDTDWRTKLLAESETTQVTNQNSYEKKPVIYAGMKFSSPPEVKIAIALDNLGVMYLPNCLTRVGTPGSRQNRFPDFLICYAGKWGILEIDGQSVHKGNATEDHERSRLIERHGGVAYFTRYPAARCQSDPDGVVKEFLEILKNK